MVIVIGVTGAIYACVGGSGPVAISDTLNGIGLLVIGVLVPVFGLLALGGGDLLAGLTTLTTEHPGKADAIGSSDDPTPFGTIFTGMVFCQPVLLVHQSIRHPAHFGAQSLASRSTKPIRG